MREHEYALPPEPQPRRVARVARPGEHGERVAPEREGAHAELGRAHRAHLLRTDAPCARGRGAHWRQSRCDVPRRRRAAGRSAADDGPPAVAAARRAVGAGADAARRPPRPLARRRSTSSRGCCRPTLPARHLRRRGLARPRRRSGSRTCALRGLPPVPGLSSFPQLEVRTYVTVDGRPGVWLCSARRLERRSLARGGEAHAPAAGLPRADLGRARRRRLRASRRSATGSRSARATGRRARRSPPSPGSLEHFLTERYALYTADGGRLYRAELHHAPWRLQARPGDGRGEHARAGRRSRASRTCSSPPRRTCSSGRWRSCEPAAADGARLGRRGRPRSSR